MRYECSTCKGDPFKALDYCVAIKAVGRQAEMGGCEQLVTFLKVDTQRIRRRRFCPAKRLVGLSLGCVTAYLFAEG
jgi:hypothetical protein